MTVREVIKIIVLIEHKQYKTRGYENCMGIKEERINAVRHIYYANPKVQKMMLEFSKDREVVPCYMGESFGKRPDVLMYNSDINGLVRKGATSFHGSEELWDNPLNLSSEISTKEMAKLRKGWDLLIDIDSPFLDCSKIAARLIIEALEQHGVMNYGIKFSGSKGFHIIVGGRAFPAEFDGMKAGEMFPVWPRAVCSYLMSYIRRDYNLKAGEILSVENLEKRTKLKKEDLLGTGCKNCGRSAIRGVSVDLNCPECGLNIKRRDFKLTKRRLKCLNNDCAGILELGRSEEYYYCENCKDSDNEKMPLSSDKHPEVFEKVKGVNAEKVANLDLVLVAPRHLFRMPYSLHEKTALASIVLGKEEIDSFKPNDADPLKVNVIEYYPKNVIGEGKRLLSEALEWRRGQEIIDEGIEVKRYKGKKNFEGVELKNVSEDMFPKPIKKLLKGLEDGRKRGLFVLLTFLRNVGFSGEAIQKRIKEWNEENEPPLREGYVRSQIDWHLKQKRKILPPNYSNDSFYRDLGILDGKPKVKNPLVDVMRSVRGR